MKEHIAHYLLKGINPLNWLRGIRSFIVSIPRKARSFCSFVVFFVILIFFIVRKISSLFCRIPLLGIFFRKLRPLVKATFGKVDDSVINALEKVRPFQVRQSYLVEIAYQNLRARASRTLVTVFGMATGIGIIVYLLSLGYGIEKLVISQVASLDELKIIDVVASQNTTLKMDKSTLQKIRKLEDVDDVAPLISLVGRINFNKAQTDVLVYAADQKFLDIGHLNIKKGKLFVDTERAEDSLSSVDGEGNVAGEQTAIKQGTYKGLVQEQLVEFNFKPMEAIPVWESCDISSELLGYTSRTDASLMGKQIWGSTYAPYDKGGRSGYDKARNMYLGMWVQSKVPLFYADVDSILHPSLDSNGNHIWINGCIEQKSVTIDSDSLASKLQKATLNQGSVLGESTEDSKSTVLAAQVEASAAARLEQAIAAAGVEATGSATPSYYTEVIATDSAGIEQVQLVASADAQLALDKKPITFLEKPILQAVISTGLMKLLNIDEGDVIGKTFDVSFIIGESLRPDIKGRQMSESMKYTVVGLIDDDQAQYFYVPFSDIRKLGVKNYSQLKVVLKNEKGLPKIRTQIEGFGYNTTSVIDTVSQIESLFGTLRLVLASIGLIALAVASLGMFNTLTVSLLERTREIGGMKVIGMVSEEIQDLFLAEAMIMGFSGGVGGLIIGYLFGQLTSIIVSAFSIAQGLGYLELTFIPWPFTLSILVLSFIVGILTGLYPAKRARSISALNALRYE